MGIVKSDAKKNANILFSGLVVLQAEVVSLNGSRGHGFTTRPFFFVARYSEA